MDDLLSTFERIKIAHKSKDKDRTVSRNVSKKTLKDQIFKVKECSLNTFKDRVYLSRNQLNNLSLPIGSLVKLASLDEKKRSYFFLVEVWIGSNIEDEFIEIPSFLQNILNLKPGDCCKFLAFENEIFIKSSSISCLKRVVVEFCDEINHLEFKSLQRELQGFRFILNDSCGFYKHFIFKVQILKPVIQLGIVITEKTTIEPCKNLQFQPSPSLSPKLSKYIACLEEYTDKYFNFLSSYSKSIHRPFRGGLFFSIENDLSYFQEIFQIFINRYSGFYQISVISSTSLLSSQYEGEAETQLVTAFKNNQIIFFYDVHVLISKNVKTANAKKLQQLLLSLFDEFPQVFCIGSSCEPPDFVSALLLKSDRFGFTVEIVPPNFNQKKLYFTELLQHVKIEDDVNDAFFEEIIRDCHNHSFKDMEDVFKEAIHECIIQDKQKISRSILKRSLQLSKPISKKQVNI